MFLCLGATPLIPNINTALVAIIATAMIEAIIQELVKDFYKILKEWMQMCIYDSIILLGTAGISSRAEFYSN